MLHVNVILTAITRVVSAGLMLSASIMVARYLGPEGQGCYALVITLAASIAQFANLGMHVSNTYLAAQDRRTAAALLANSLWISILLAATIGSAAFYFGEQWYGLPGSHWWLCVLGAGLVFGRLFFALGTGLLAGLNRFRLLNCMELFNYALPAGAILMARWRGGGIDQVIIGIVVGSIITAVVLFLALAHTGGCAWLPDAATFRRGMNFGARAYVTCLLSFLVLRVNVFVLGLWYGKDVLGQYAIASQMFDFLNLIPASVALVLFPRLIQTTTDRWRLMLRGTALTGVLMLLICGGAAVVARPLVLFVFGPSFEAAVPMIWCMLPAVLFCSMTTIVSQFLAASGYPRELIGSWMFALVVELILALILIPRFAGIGASVALTSAFVISFVLSVRLAWSIQQRTVIDEPRQIARMAA